MWKVATTDDFDGWFAELDEDEQTEVTSKVDLLKILGPQLSRPHADTLNGSQYANMKELRGKTATAVLRVAFAFDTNREAILLVGGDKAGVSQKRFYKVLIEAADKLFAAHQAKLTKSKGKGKGESNG